jgi:hypothetical protein
MSRKVVGSNVGKIGKLARERHSKMTQAVNSENRLKSDELQ